MKRLILVGLVPPPYNGQSIAFEVLTDRLKQSGMHVDVVDISYRGGMKKGGRGSLGRSMDFVMVFAQLVRLCLGGNFIVYLQIAQSRRGFMRDVLINRVSRFFGGQTVTHLHGGNYGAFYDQQDERLKKLIRRELNSYHSIIILSNRLLGMFDFMPAILPKLKSIPNGIGQAVVQPAGKVLPRMDIGEPVVLLYLSNMILSKGYMRVLEAVRRVNNTGLPIKAVFCGAFLTEDGGNDVNIEEVKRHFFDSVSAFGLQKNVQYCGVLSGDDKELVLNEAHYFVLPTSYHNEGQPISIIEAMRAGCVTLSTDYRAIPDLIVDEVTGYLLRSGDPMEIADVILQSVRDANSYNRMSMNAIVRYNEQFTADKHAEAMVSLLREAAQKV